jgi:RimJ/RimL family protein N-acetyltransferase
MKGNKKGIDLSPLFRGSKIYLAASDASQEAEIESRWSEDPSYLALIQTEPVRPLSPAQIQKKGYSHENRNDHYLFGIRKLDDQQLIGYIEIRNIQWNHNIAWIAVRIGEDAYRRRGYGSEALELLLRYAFNELNLEQLIGVVFEYNIGAQMFFEKFGFTVDVRQRQALQRFGRRWDVFLMSNHRADWEARGSSTPGRKLHG